MNSVVLILRKYMQVPADASFTQGRSCNVLEKGTQVAEGNMWCGICARLLSTQIPGPAVLAELCPVNNILSKHDSDQYSARLPSRLLVDILCLSLAPIFYLHLTYTKHTNVTQHSGRVLSGGKSVKSRCCVVLLREKAQSTWHDHIWWTRDWESASIY